MRNVLLNDPLCTGKYLIWHVAIRPNSIKGMVTHSAFSSVCALAKHHLWLSSAPSIDTAR
jgi:hypothetical protein